MQRELQIVSRRGGTISHAGRAFMKVCEQFAVNTQGRYMFQPQKKIAAKTKGA
jgi:hypothetical protein